VPMLMLKSCHLQFMDHSILNRMNLPHLCKHAAHILKHSASTITSTHTYIRHEILISFRGFVQGVVDQPYPMKYKKKIPKRMRRPFPQAREPET